MVVSSENSEKNRDYLKEQYEILIPTSIFLDRRISILEALSEYLKEKYKLRYVEIAKLTNRDPRNIRTAYLRTKNKRTDRKVFENHAFFPLKIVKDRTKPIFESIIYYLRKQGASNKALAIIFNRSEKTISTIYNRAKKR